MKKHIAEELPARKFPQASLSKSNEKSQDDKKGDSQSKSPEQRVRQAVYDIRYRARREDIPLRQAYTQYMQNSSLSEQEKSLVREKLFGKGGIVKENYIKDVSDLASSSVAKALYNVFVEKKTEEYNQEDIEELKSHLNEYSSGGDRKYKVRVTDKNGTSYVRYATREKINALRANSNIQSVEMTEYGEPYEGERSKGQTTAAATAGKDWDKDGKKESPAKEYRGAVHNAIQRRRGGTPDGKDTSNVKEEFIGEVKDNNPTIDIKSKKKPNKIVVYHNGKKEDQMNESSYNKFLSLISERKMTSSEVKKEKKLKKKYDKSGMKASMKKQYGEKGENVYFATIRKQAMKEGSNCGCDDEPKLKKSESSISDVREIPTKINLVKNKLRAMGLKMSYEPEGEMVDEGLGKIGIGAALLATPYLMTKLKPTVDNWIERESKTSRIGGKRRSGEK